MRHALTGFRSLSVRGVLALAFLISAASYAELGAPERSRPTVINVSIDLIDESEVSHFDELLRRFELEQESPDRTLLRRYRQQPHVRVNRVEHPQDLPGVLRQQRDGRPTDGIPQLHLVAFDNVHLWRYGVGGLMEDVGALVDELNRRDRSLTSYPPFSQFLAMQDRYLGGRFFLPLRFNARLAYANRERLEALRLSPPGSLQELRNVAAALALRDGQARVTLSLAAGDPVAVTMSELIRSYGGNPLVLNDKGSLDAFRFVQDLWEAELISDLSLAAKFDTEVDFLRKGETWVAQNWSYTSANLAAAQRLDGFDVSPGWTGPAGAHHVIGGEALGIPAGNGATDAQRRVARDLAMFLLSQRSQEFLARTNAWPPVRQDALAGVPEHLQPTFTAIAVALRSGWYRPAVPYWGMVSHSIDRAVRRVVVRGEHVETVLDQMHADIERAARDAGSEYPPPDP